MYFSISIAAAYLGVAISTLRRWDHQNIFHPDYLTPGVHRRYSLASIRDFLGDSLPSECSESSKKTVLYSRVSSADQRLDLERQSQRLEEYCHKKQYENIVSIRDLGSGINYKKPGLNKLIKMLLSNQVRRIVIFHKDRLLRFGSELIFKVCAALQVEVEVMETQMNQSFEEELAADVLEIMTVFSARLYGKRAHQNRKYSKGTFTDSEVKRAV